MTWEERLAVEGYQVVGQQARRPLGPPAGPDLPEAALLATIRQLAKQYGWQCYHTHDSRRSESGYPDITLTDGTSVLVYELKTNTGKLTQEQLHWLSLLAHTGKVECGIWRPRDLPAIRARLSRTREEHSRRETLDGS